MDIFNECEKLFSNGEIHKAIDKSKKYIINYTSSYYLKLRIGFYLLCIHGKVQMKKNVRK